MDWLPLRARTRKMRGIFRAGRYAIAYVRRSPDSGSTLRPLHGICLRTCRARAYGAVSLTRPRLLVAYAGVIRRAGEGHGGRHRLRLSVALRPRMRCSLPMVAHLYPLRTSPRRWRPTSRPCAPPHACRYALCGYGCIERGGWCGGRSAKPRGAAPECRVELRPTRHRATSHNGARYAFVRSKTRSHVALSGAPPRPSPLKKSGSRTRHIF